MTPSQQYAATGAAIRVTMPFPPSVHGLYRGGRWRGDPSPAYKAWRDEAGYRLNRQCRVQLAGPVRIIIRLVPPDAKERDSDNYVKAVLDLLVAHRVIEGDDSRIVRSHYVEWADEGEPCTVVVQAADAETWEPIGRAVERIIAALPVLMRGAA